MTPPPPPPTTTEAVLLVPRTLTKSAYETLVNNGCVARRWHLEGRYGSRTHAEGDRMGLPLLSYAAQSMEALLAGTPDHDGRDALGKEVQELISNDGVEIIYKTVPLPSSVPRPQCIDATFHRDRAPAQLPTKRRRVVVDRDRPAFTFAELFCGIGGFGVALEALGGRCVFASEIEESCCEIYADNLGVPLKGMHGDIYDVPNAELPNFDLLVGGFPCQPFSSLGDQPGFSDGPRGLLYTQIVRVLKARQPKAFLLENVPGLKQTGEALNTIVASLEEVGYSVTVEVCSARCLTAQSRKRLFFVGLLVDKTSVAASTFQFPFIPDLGLRAADVILYDGGDAAAIEALDDVIDSPSPDLSLTDAQMDQLLSRSKRWKPAKLAWPDNVCDTMDGHYGVTVGKGNSQLVPRRAPLHPRCFTPGECARLMGFPASFRMGEPKLGQGERAHLKKQYHMFGNAVCPPLIAALAGAVLDQCPGIAGYSYHRDWRTLGLEVAISLALDSVLPHRQEAVWIRLQKLSYNVMPL